MSESLKTSKKLKTELPVYVVEDHNEALKHVYREIGRKKLPIDGFRFVHFDSHPDLLIPKNLDPEKILDKQHVFEAISIENWIMPAVFAGHLTEVVWIKPPWATETIPDCSREFHIGLRRDTRQIRVTCPYSYFVSELLWAPLKNLERVRPSRLTVFSLGKMLDPLDPANRGPTNRGLSGSASPSSEDAAEEIKAALAARLSSADEAGGADERGSPYRPYALDIDLDFYSTKNPFLREVGDKILEILKDLYYFKMPPCHTEEELEMVSRDRQLQLDQLSSKLRQTILINDDEAISRDSPRLSESVVEASESQSSSSTKRLSDGICAEAASVTDGSSSTLTSDLRLTSLREAVDEFLAKERATLSANQAQQAPAASSKEEEEGDSTSKFLITKDRSDLPEYLHEVGCTCDETPLPHHVSSQRQIEHLIAETTTFLKTLPKPAVVTLARSSLDEYCPQDQVDDIQAKVLKMLEQLYGPLKVTLDY